MEIRPYLKDKRQTSEKWYSGRILFNLIFILSLGLNVYLLTYSEEPNLPFAPESKNLEVPEDENESTIEKTHLDHEALDRVTPIHAEPVLITTAPVTPDPVKIEKSSLKNHQQTPPSYSITPASFVVPEPQKGPAVHALHLTIQNSLTYSVCRVMTREAGCETMAAYTSRLLSWFLDVNKSMRKGDALDVAYERVPGQTRFRILKLIYNSNFHNKVFEANYFPQGNQGFGAYYDPDGVEIAKRIVDKYAPVREYQEITSLPGDFRKGPVGHEGTDFKTEVGTDVYASFEGRVTRTNWNRRANGYCVELDHPREGVKTLYLHLSRVLVKPGQFVKGGDKIAETGNTGRTFAPHLHYEIKSRGNKKIVYNPFNFKHIKSYHQEVPREESANFQETVNRYNSILQKG